jgi:hypothetical protein
MDINTNSSPAADRLDRTLLFLRAGEASVEGLFPLGSNTTIFCRMDFEGGSIPAVYKPCRGERPLWDFPAGSLALREAAAFVVSRDLGWDFVPPTVFREEGPFGPGSFQEFLMLDPESNYFTLRESEPDGLRRIAAFDVLINNADRKALHVLRDASGRIRLIDHGICFHEVPKLRTVIWDFAGEKVPSDILAAIHDLRRRLERGSPIAAALRDLLSSDEIAALSMRAAEMEEIGRYPEPGSEWSVPWPIWA